MTNKTVISEYWSDDDGKSKHAVVCLMGGRYIIDFYENTEYTHSTLYAYEDKSLHYVEDAAENFVLGHFKNYRDYR